MGFIGWGIALIVIGLLLSFSNLFGFVLGAPLVYLGWVLLAIGVVVAILHFVMGGTDRHIVRRT